MLTQAQKAQYERDGFVVLRNQFSEAEMSGLDEAFARNPPLNANMGSLNYPEPGRYTLAKSCFKDPGFARFAEHPTVLGGARTLLDDEVHLTAFVLYDRTPGGPPIGMHNDYKRWRPVGSSMHWLFTIIPLNDFDETTGQLFVYPGSHRLDRVKNVGGRALHVDPAVFPDSNGFIDPELRRGDLLFMNMHTWHHAAGNQSEHHRVGLFNKYAARSFPPATGPFVFDDEAAEALSPENRDLLAVHSNKPVARTRLILERSNAGKREFFLQDSSDGPVFPGGPVYAELAIPDWDYGNYIESLREAIRSQLQIELPWVTWVGDYPENIEAADSQGDPAGGLCRVYAYALSGQGFPVPLRGGQWLSGEEVAACGSLGYEKHALASWLDERLTRGKGVSQAQARVDQYAV